ncbi:MAG TPA: hypothetical protein VMU16_09055 [Candidatus Binataceae bacterium]|nr:hypothetical protein [Candidatus Binataceae bacterium]
MVKDGDNPQPVCVMSSREWLAASTVALILAIAFGYPLIRQLDSPGVFHDWDFSLQLQWAAYYSIVHFDQLPLWNPWKCGGMPLLGNPQSHFLSPWFLLTLAFGPVVGLHLEVIGHFIAAWLGTYVLGRTLAMKPMAATVAACAFSMSSWFNLHACEGHIVFLAIAYSPWILALAIIGSSPGAMSASIGAGAMLAMVFLEGYVPVFIVVVLGTVMIGMAIARGSMRPIWSLLTVGIFATGFAAIKLIPASEVLAAHPRPTPFAYVNDWAAIGTALFSRNQDLLRASPNAQGFHELGAYLGLFCIPAVIGLASWRRAMPWAFASAVIIMLARGATGPQSLWMLIHQLPIGSELRLPARFLMIAPLTVGVLAGFGFDSILLMRSRAVPVLAAVFLGLAVADEFLVTVPNLKYAVEWTVHPSVPSAQFRQYRLAPQPTGGYQVVRASMYEIARENLGIVACYEYEDNWNTSAIGAEQPGYRGEQYLLGAGSVLPALWTPNELTYDVDVPAPATLVVNQNYDPGWQVASGPGHQISQSGLLAVTVPAGKSEIVIGYRPWSVVFGALITILTAVAALVIPRVMRTRPPYFGGDDAAI